MAIRRNLVYTSFHREANFYEVIYNGRVAAFEVTGKDLRYSGRVERSVFNRLLTETKKQDGATYERKPRIEMEKIYQRDDKPEIISRDGNYKVYQTIQKKTKGKYQMTRSEWAWNYLPTV